MSPALQLLMDQQYSEWELFLNASTDGDSLAKNQLQEFAGYLLSTNNFAGGWLALSGSVQSITVAAQVLSRMAWSAHMGDARFRCPEITPEQLSEGKDESRRWLGNEIFGEVPVAVVMPRSVRGVLEHPALADILAGQPQQSRSGAVFIPRCKLIVLEPKAATFQAPMPAAVRDLMLHVHLLGIAGMQPLRMFGHMPELLPRVRSWAEVGLGRLMFNGAFAR